MASIPLQYEISAFGEGNVRRVMRGIEREAQSSLRRAERMATTRRGGVSADRAAAVAVAKQHSLEMRAAEKLAREKDRLAQKEFNEKARHARRLGRIQVQEEVKAARRGARERARAESAAIAARRNTVRDVRRGVGTTLGNVGRFAIGGAALVGGFAAGSAVQEQTAIRAGASQLANQAGRPEIKGQLAQEVQSFAGFTGSEVLGGLQSFVDVTGDLESARGLMAELTQLALASGTALEDLGGAAGAVFVPLNDQIKDPVERLKTLKSLLRTAAGQGAIGAIELRDLAAQGAGLVAPASKFEGDADRNIAVMGAIAQASRQRGGSASAAEAITAAGRFSTDLITKAGKIKKDLGIDVMNEEGTKLRAADQLIPEILKATGGKLQPLTKLFGERGIRAIQGFSPLFTQAGGGEAGVKAVQAEFGRFERAAISEEDVATRSASRLADEDIRFKEVSKEFSKEIGTRLIPALIRLIPTIERSIDPLARLTEAVAKTAAWFLDNPFSGVGIVVAGALAKEIVAAKIGSVISGALTSGVGGAAAGGVAAKAGGSALGGAAAGAAGAGALAAAAPLAAITAAIGAWLLALDQMTRLAKATEGFAGIGAGIKSLLTEGSFFAGVDAHMDEQARERARAEGRVFGPEAKAKLAIEQAGGKEAHGRQAAADLLGIPRGPADNVAALFGGTPRQAAESPLASVAPEFQAPAEQQVKLDATSLDKTASKFDGAIARFESAVWRIPGGGSQSPIIR